jgi:FAD synthetase
MIAGDDAPAKTSPVANNVNNATTPVKDEIEETQNLAEQCERVHKKVYDFLDRKAEPGSRIEQVQRQTRESLAVIAEALQRYRSVHASTQPLSIN